MGMGQGTGNMQTELLTPYLNDKHKIIVKDVLPEENNSGVQPTLGFQRVLQRAVFHVQSSGKKEVTSSNVLVAIGVTGWVGVCRLVRAQFLSLRASDFVRAARSMGASNFHIIVRHMLPNALSPIIVGLAMGIPMAIFAEAGLSFLGLGINPPTPSWGQMVSSHLPNVIYYWHLALFPVFMIALVMLGFSLIGDGLRDALDPRMNE